MKINSNSLGFKLIAPSLLIIAVVFVSLVVIIADISRTIQGDYSRFVITAVNDEVEKILSTAATELTSAYLSNNREVIAAKRKSVEEALKLLWPRMSHDGIIAAADGAVVFSSLPERLTRAILAGNTDGYHTFSDSTGEYYCFTEKFPLWGWRVVTVNRNSVSLLGKTEARFLLPIVTVGCLLMIVGVFLVLKRAVGRPVQIMVSAVNRGHIVESTGTTEFDIIGNAVNDAFRRLHDRELALEDELVERQLAEEELRSRDEHIHRLLSFTEEGIYGIDLDGRCTFCNISCLKMLGYEKEDQLLGVRMHDLIHHTTPDGSPAPFDTSKIRLSFRSEIKVHVDNEVFWRTDGSSFPVEYWSHPVYEQDRPCGAVVTFLDISHRKQLEDQLIQAQKMESIGRLAGGIAHDFNNLLTPIIGYSEFLKEDLPDNDPATLKAERILKAANRAQNLVQQLLSFSRKQIMELKPININQIISAFHDIVRRTVRENIEIRLHLSEGKHAVHGDKNQIEQVIMNLVVNAQDAIADSGIITVETAQVLLDDEYACHHAEVTPGHYLMLAVTDTGCGMDRETRQRIFEPFFTTKGIGKGTGLGLATVYGIVRQHGGNIWVYSEPGAGTTFKVYFPLIDAEPTVETPVIADRLQLAAERFTILVVEDNDMVKNMVHELLVRHGYEVLSYSSPKEATQEVKERRLDLLIADVVMPEMNGPELHHRLLATHPDLKVLYMSGYTSNAIVRQGVLKEGIQYIQKPFAISEFARKVHTMLSS